MANPNHIAILKQGIDVWNEWRAGHNNVAPDLSSADLQGEDLGSADLDGADLSGANLRGAALSKAHLNRADLSAAALSASDLSSTSLERADLSDATLIGARLARADLAGANLTLATLRGADLTGASLAGAALNGANLRWANLRGADFTNAILFAVILAGTDLSESQFRWTNVAACDLRGAKGLETVTHAGPSYLSIDTIYRSEGQIPEAFLLGCGVPDSFIAQIPALVGALQPIQFYSCFISYSTKDGEFSGRLHERMRAEKLRVWFSPEDIQGGRKLHEQIERAIQVHDRLLLVLSENSIRSEWVITEIRNALRVERKDGRRKLFPIRLCGFDALRRWECFDADFGKDLANEVRQYFIPDFSNWKNHDDFEAAFARLLRDLRASEP